MKVLPRSGRASMNARIYILPTRYGTLYLISLFVMVMIGGAYSNNLVYLLAFLLFSTFLVSMIQTHFNLKDLGLELIRIDDGFSGQKALAFIRLTNDSRDIKQSLRLRILPGPARSQLLRFRARKSPDHVQDSAVTYLPELSPKVSRIQEVSFLLGPRGRYAPPKIRVETRYPLGLFRAWRTIRAESPHYFVYPEPRGEVLLRTTVIDGWGDRSPEPVTAASGTDFREHRPFRPEDSRRHIDWKAFARGRPLLVKEFEGADQPLAFLRWSDLAPAPSENRLSQLALWVHEAEKKRIPFELELPGRSIRAGSGQSHAQACLRELSVFEEESR